MKKVLSLAVAAGLIAATTAAFGATIVGSKHDLSGTGTAALSGGGTSTQICVYCHAPHNANLSLPLWNRTNPAANGFTLYSGVGMQSVSFKTGFTADSTSLFCMSCHDGVTGIDAVHNAGAIESTDSNAVHSAAAGTFAGGTIAGAGNLTTNLSKTHPINFPVVTVNNAQADLNVGVGASMGPGVAPGYAWGGKTYPLFKSSNGGGARDTANRSLECGSCHAVHDSAFSPFLRDTMAGSQLCLGCHNK